MMLAVVIPIAWALLAILMRPALQGRRKALLLAAVAVGIWLVAGTEVLGAMGKLTRTSLLVWWGVTDVLLLIAMELALPPMRPWLVGLPPKQWGINEIATGAILTLAALLLGISGISAIFSPANIEGTSNASSVTAPSPPGGSPLSGYIGLHYRVISHGSHWANSLPWQSAVMTMAAVSLIVARSGGGAVAQALAALLVIASPPFFLAASTPNNDTLLAQWICTLVVMAMSIVQTQSVSISKAVWTALTLVLIVLTKGSGPYFALPVCILIVAIAGWLQPRAALGWTASVAAIVAAVLAPFWAWSVGAQGYSAELPAARSMNLNRDHSPPALAAVLLCNIGSHLQLPGDGMNQRVTTGVNTARASLLGITDESPRWRANTRDDAPFVVRYAPGLQPFTGSAAELVLAAMLPFLGIIARKELRGTLFWLLLPLPYAAFLVYTIAFRWHLAGVRMEIPAFCLLAPPAALLLTTRRMRVAAGILLPLILLYLLPTLLASGRALWSPKAAENDRPKVVLRESNIAHI